MWDQEKELSLLNMGLPYFPSLHLVLLMSCEPHGHVYKDHRVQERASAFLALARGASRDWTVSPSMVFAKSMLYYSFPRNPQRQDSSLPRSFRPATALMQNMFPPSFFSQLMDVPRLFCAVQYREPKGLEDLTQKEISPASIINWGMTY